MKKRMALISALLVLFIASALVVSCPQNVEDVTVADASTMTVEFTKTTAGSSGLNFDITGATIKDVSKVTVTKAATITETSVTGVASGTGKTLTVTFKATDSVATTDSGTYTISIPANALEIDSTHKYPATAITKAVTVNVTE